MSESSDHSSSYRSDETASTGSSGGRRKKSVYRGPRLKWENNHEFMYVTLAVVFTLELFDKPFTTRKGLNEPSVFHRFLVCLGIAMPLFYLEIFFGQYSQLGATQIKLMVPLLRGLGFTLLEAVILRLIKFGIYQADLLMYCLISMQKRLPWMNCPKNYKHACWDPFGEGNCTRNCITSEVRIPSYIFWRYIYMKGPNLEDMRVDVGKPSWTRMVTLVCSWSLLAILLVNFMHRYKLMVKLCLFISTAFLIILIAVCLITKGAYHGIELLFTVDYHAVFNSAAWSKAIGNVIEHMALGRAVHIMHGSYLPANSQTEVLSVLCAFCNFIQTFLCFFVTASATGIIMNAAKMDSDNLDLIYDKFIPNIFTVIPCGLGFISASQLWSILYFLTCILAIGINQSIHLLIAEKCITDTFPTMLRYRKYVVVLLGFACVLLSIVFLSNEAFPMAQFVTYKVSRATEIINALILTIGICYIYGVQKVCDDIHFFTGSQPTIFWKCCWYSLPVLISFPTSYYFLNMYYLSPAFRWFNVLFMFVIMSPLIIYAMLEFIRSVKDQSLMRMIKPKERWGPMDPEERHLRRMFNPRKEIRSKRRREVCQHNCLIASKAVQKFKEEEARRRNAKNVAHYFKSLYSDTSPERKNQ